MNNSAVLGFLCAASEGMYSTGRAALGVRVVVVVVVGVGGGGGCFGLHLVCPDGRSQQHIHVPCRTLTNPSAAC